MALTGLGFGVAWLLWMVLGRVAVHEVSHLARVEVADAVHPIQATVSGRVMDVRVEVGDTVEAGQLLLELDASEQELRLEEARAVVAALTPELEALDGIAAAERGAADASRAATSAARSQAQAKYEEASIEASYAEDRLKNLQALFSQGLIAEKELQEARVKAERLRAAATAALLELDRLAWDGATNLKDRATVQVEAAREEARLRGELAVALATVARLEEAVARRQIRASTAGRIAEMAPLRSGRMVREGDLLGSIIPGGELHVIAHFRPADAFGRIHPDQRGRLRVDGFPWTQYGSVPVTVKQVATETRAGQVRVELGITGQDQLAVPLQHGMAGSVEIEVERTAPAILVLRAAGGLLSPRSR